MAKHINAVYRFFIFGIFVVQICEILGKGGKSSGSRSSSKSSSSNYGSSSSHTSNYGSSSHSGSVGSSSNYGSTGSRTKYDSSNYGSAGSSRIFSSLGSSSSNYGSSNNYGSSSYGSVVSSSNYGSVGSSGNYEENEEKSVRRRRSKLETWQIILLVLGAVGGLCGFFACVCAKVIGSRCNTDTNYAEKILLASG